MVLFSIIKKTHDEKPEDVHVYRITLRAKEGHRLTLTVDESEFEGYIIGDRLDVAWGQFQRRLTEVPPR